jgi:ornithine decarboxylase
MIKPFFVASESAVWKRVALWADELGKHGVTPFYAVKCNPDRHLIRLASSAGWGFDCASPLEIRTVRDVAPAASLIYANPCKSPNAITATKDERVLTTFDSPEEFVKLLAHEWDEDKLVLRIRVDDSKSLQPFGTKFGCNPAAVDELMKVVTARGVRLAGISFHVGSHCYGKGAYTSALGAAHELIRRYSYSFTRNAPVTVDIGGGFPGVDDELFRLHAADIRAAMKKEIAGLPLEYIAEPGRFLATSPYTLHVPIICKRRVGDEYQYTIDESRYSSFSGIPFDGLKLDLANTSRGTKRRSIIFGRTCDSQDIIMKGELAEMEVGDYMVFRNIGAYTSASSSTFNGFEQTEVHWLPHVLA